MLPREMVRFIGAVERRIIFENYRQHGPLWDIVINDIVRNPEYAQLPANVQGIYINNAARRNASRRRVIETTFIENREG
jgi:hypothetical protein